MGRVSRRVLWRLGAAVAALALGTGLTLLVVNRGGGRVEEGTTEGELVTQYDQLGQLDDSLAHDGVPTPTGVPLAEDAPGPARPRRGSVLIGWLLEERLAAVPLGRLATATERGDAKFLRAGLVSPVVGVPDVVTVLDGQIYLGATDHTQLVRLRDWRRPEVLSVTRGLGHLPGGYVEFGAIIPWKDRLLVLLEFTGAKSEESETGIVEVDPRRWAVRRARALAGRWGRPEACITADGTLAVKARSDETDKSILDLLDPETMARRASIPLPFPSTSLACAGNDLWIGRLSGPGPDGLVIRSDGSTRGRFRIGGPRKGMGIHQLVYDAGRSRIFGNVPNHRRIFSCSTVSLRCRRSGDLGMGPTEFMLQGDTLFAGDHQSEQIAQVDPDTLRLRGKLKFRGPPKTLTYYP